MAEPWPTILRATFLPHLEFNFQFLFVITGVLGTTISPYMFFWQASEETEEERAANLIGKDGRPRITWGFIRNMRIDNFTGMLFSQFVSWSIIVVAATVLHGNGVTNVQTAADAAHALLPLVHTFPNAGFISQRLVFELAGLADLSLRVFYITDRKSMLVPLRFHYASSLS